jgi:hypothetical protein
MSAFAWLNGSTEKKEGSSNGSVTSSDSTELSAAREASALLLQMETLQDSVSI